MSEIAIYHKIDCPQPIRFATRELRRCLKAMTDHDLNIIECREFPADAKSAILIGETADLGNPIAKNELDDEILVTQNYGTCTITGSNSRSVLFAAYALLEEFGARWIGPGRDGEHLPKAKLDNIIKIDIHSRASYRHRGVCIEGAPSIKHALDMIDWMTKKRMNTFFLQFKTSIYFWRQWYDRRYNEKFLKPIDVDEEMSLKMDDQVIKALRKRGLILHRVGHGWTAESIGLQGLGWYRYDGELGDDQREMIAEINGKRELFGKMPINTELCYSNMKAFNTLADHVVEYAEKHPEVDCLHFWLSDAPNNFCECAECRELSQSDHYAELVKAVSSKLKMKGIGTRIVFLCYTNTLSAPEIEKINRDIDNVVFMFAPISRCYQHSLTDEGCDNNIDIGDWGLNKIEPPKTNAGFIKILKRWQEKYDGDSFIFDYYLWRPFHDSLNSLGIGKIIHKDMNDLGMLKLNGHISCQVLRCFYPLGIPMLIMAEVLWERDIPFTDIINKHLRTIFPNDIDMIRLYLEELDESLDAGEDHVSIFQSYNFEKIVDLIALLDNWQPYIASLYGNAENVIMRRYSYNLMHHHKLLRFRALSSLYNAKGDKDKAKKCTDEMVDFLKKTERRTHHHLDTWMLMHTLGRA